jgi:hypothetical protein
MPRARRTSILWLIAYVPFGIEAEWKKFLILEPMPIVAGILPYVITKKFHVITNLGAEP